MSNVKKVALALLVLLGAAAALELAPAPAAAYPHPCTGVRCMECPAGEVLSPSPGNCCRCVKA